MGAVFFCFSFLCFIIWRMDETKAKAKDLTLTEDGPKTVDIHPLTRGRRVLAFLADFFLIAILSLLLFHIAVYPIAGVITHSDERYHSYVYDAGQRDAVLYGKELLFYEQTSNMDYSSFSTNLIYTCKLFTSYYVLEGNEKEAKYEVFSTYYESLRPKTLQIADIYKKIDAKAQYFSFDNGTITLKDPYKTEFLPLYRAGDALSSKGKTDYEAYQKDFFIVAYSNLIKDVKENDLVYNGISYAQKQKLVEAYVRYSDAMVVASALIAYLISTAVVALLFPIISSRRKTLGMMALRYERVTISEFKVLAQWKSVLIFVYMFALCSGALLFIPWGVVSFNELFSLPMLLLLSLVGMGLDIISLAFFFFDPFGRTLMDRLTFSFMVNQETLGDICRAKGYDF